VNPIIFIPARLGRCACRQGASVDLGQADDRSRAGAREGGRSRPVVVATDAREIADAVEAAGGQAS